MTRIKFKIDTVVLIADLVGTTVFAVEGALAAIRGHLDLLGVMVIAFMSALGGGVIRDVLIGATPPNAIRDWRYPALTFSAGVLTFAFFPLAGAIPRQTLLTLDAAGLALFAVAGVEKALMFNIHPFIAMLLGTVTGVGGGVIRDVLMNQVPAILRTDIYAVAAFFGAGVVLACRRMGWTAGMAGLAGGIACFALRMLSLHYGWQLPKVG